MFQLTQDELSNLMSQIVTSSWGGRRKLPVGFKIGKQEDKILK
jgi:hypothetical protein